MALLQQVTSDLPPHSREALIVIAERVKARLEKAGGLPPEEVAAVTSFIFRFAGKYQIPLTIPLDHDGSVKGLTQAVTSILAQRVEILRESIESEVDGVLLDYAAGEAGAIFGQARLTIDEKKKIHQHLEKIRAIIEAGEMDDRKRHALMERLNALRREVDLQSTKTDRFFSFLGDLGFALGSFGKDTQPLWHEAREMIKAVSRARARQEGVSLPPGDDPLALPEAPEN